MRVILVPTRLRWATALLFICLPIAAFETVLVTRAPWWRLPYQAMEVWSASVFLILLPISVWIAQGRAWAVRALEVFFGVWLFLNAWVAVRTGNPGLGFLSVGLLALSGIWVTWIRHELQRSFFDPRMSWYQGLPRPMPGVRCRVSWGEREVECKVSRLDREGAFVFQAGSSAAAPSLEGLRTGVSSALTFDFRERSVRCTGFPVRALSGDRGAGFQFDGLAPDLRKQLGDFIEILRGEGYVV